MPSLTVALAGNPNSGKTTLFNRLTGARQRVGNYPGVTVEWKEGVRRTADGDVRFVDLPGTYSLTAYSEEELVARDYLLSERPDVVVDVVDASNLERNLYLTTELMELGLPLVVVLNMSDVADARGLRIDERQLARRLGAPVVRAVGSRGEGLEAIIASVLDVASRNGDGDPARVDFGAHVEPHVAEVVRALGDLDAPPPPRQRRWFAVKLIERDEKVLAQMGDTPAAGPAAAAAAELDLDGPDTSDIEVSRRRYAYIDGVCREAVSGGDRPLRDRTDQVDRFAMHPVWGIPVFLALMFGAFHLTFTLGAP